MRATEQVATTRHWQRTRRLTLQLLAMWLLVTLGAIFFARELSSFMLFGWPFSFYLAAQGTILIYLAIIGCYAWRLRHFDRLLEAESRSE